MLSNFDSLLQMVHIFVFLVFNGSRSSLISVVLYFVFGTSCATMPRTIVIPADWTHIEEGSAPVVY